MKIRARANGKLLLDTSVRQFPVRVGRTEPAQVIIEHIEISRLHVQLNWDGSKLGITNLKSRNGVFIGQRQVEFESVSLPCEVKLGNSVTLELSLEDGDAVAPAASSDVTAVGVKALPPQSRLQPKPFSRPQQPEQVQLLRDLRDKLLSIGAREIFLGTLAFGVAYGIFLCVFETNRLAAIGVGVGIAFGGLAGTALLSLIVGLPGLIFQRSYRLKPIIVGFATSFALSIVANDVVMFALIPNGGAIFRLIAFLMFSVAIFVAWFAFFTTVFSEKSMRKIYWGTITVTVLGMIYGFTNILIANRSAIVAKVFTQSSGIARFVAGDAVTPRALASEIQKSESR